MKTRNVQTQQVVSDETNDLSITFYIDTKTDAANPTPRVTVHFGSVAFDRPVSDYTNLSGSQKTTLRTLLLAIRDQTYTLEGFS